MSTSVPPPAHAVTWRGTTPTVQVTCGGCSQSVAVEGVTTIAGALAALAADSLHQH